MITRPFFALAKPKLNMSVTAPSLGEAVKELAPPSHATLLAEDFTEKKDELLVKVQTEVKTGQKLPLVDGHDAYVVCPVTGTIEEIKPHKGYFRKTSMMITIRTSEKEERDTAFQSLGDQPLRQTALDFLCRLPGESDFSSVLNPSTPLQTLVINGVDADFLLSPNQWTVQHLTARLKAGAAFLKQLLPEAALVMVVTPQQLSLVENLDIPVYPVNPVYPASLPKLIMKNVFDRTVPAGKEPVDAGCRFLNAEAVVALADALEKHEIPVHKILTVIDKEGKAVQVRARVGTPVGAILEALQIETRHGDRLILGGPMTGQAVYTEDMPISYDTQGLMVQDHSRIVWSEDQQCINCGECVRVCPANIPVNMLVRVLENGLYEDAVEAYDLLSCIECGLCSAVCVARIPIFHFIMLGKYEYSRIGSGEERND